MSKSFGASGSINLGRILPRFVRKHSSSLVSTVLSASLIGKIFSGILGDQFIKNCLLSGARTKNSSQALDVLANTAASGDNHANIRVRNINSFVQYFRGD